MKRTSSESRLDYPNQTLQNKLNLAVCSGNLQQVKSLIQEGADPNCDLFAPLALFTAARHGHSDVVACLIKAGAEVNMLPMSHPMSHHNQTALHLASQNGNLETVSILIKAGANLNAKTTSGKSAFHFAAENGHIKIVSFLVEVGAELHNPLGRNAVQLAAKNGHKDVVSFLFGIGQRGWQCWGMTALDCAVENGHYDVVEMCLKMESNINLQIALALAAKNGHGKIIDLLMENGATVSLEDKRMREALLHAATNDYTEIVSYLLNIAASSTDLSFLLSEVSGEKFDLEKLRDFCKMSANLHEAVKIGRFEDAEFLINTMGVDVDFQTETGRCALHIAAQDGHTKCLSLLIESKANLNLENNHKWSALHYASFSGHLDAAEMLIEANADIFATNDSGNSPFDVANAPLRPLFRAKVQTLLQQILHWNEDLLSELTPFICG